MRAKKIIDKSLAVSNKFYRNQNIKNSELPLCKNCFYFYSESEPKNNTIIYEKSICLKYGNKNIVSGEVSYETAHNMRHLESKCGLQGKDFEEK
jgi:hypothetical protein